MALITAALAAIVPASPMPLTPSSLVGLGVIVRSRMRRRDLVRGRHQVVDQRAGHQLAGLGVVDDLLEQRLGDALRDAAVQLAFDDHRVDDVAAVVDGDVLLQIDVAGRRIDFDDADVRAERPHEVGRIEVRDRLEAVVHARRAGSRRRRRRRLRPSSWPLPGLPLTWKRPWSKTMSSADASSRCAAIFVRLVDDLAWHAACTAMPPTARLRLPYVP